MTRIRLVAPTVVFWVSALSVLLVGACSTNPVGRICFIGNDAGTDQETVVASPALECQSRTCLHVAGKSPDLCTAGCSSDDECDKSPESPCAGGFACVIPVTVGPFCCQKQCVCRDYIVIPDGGVATPDVCNSANPDNECCNLDGRRGNPDYPACS
jgi:hypothetical protein